MSTLKIIKKEHIRIGYDVSDIEVFEYAEVVAEYNAQGLLTREERYDSNDALNTLTVNTYDENGRLLQTEQFDQDNILLQKTVNKYDENGNLVAQANYYGDASDEYVTKFVNDTHNNIIRQEVYLNGKLDYVEKETVMNDGRIEVITDNDDYGNPMYVQKYEYDADGRVVKLTRDEVQNKDRRTYEFTYDERGNRVKDLIYDYDMKLIAKVLRVYDEDNKMMEYTEEDLDSFRKVKMEYDGDLVVKNTVLDKDGNIVNWSEYEYDGNGKESLAREFIHDEVQPENFRLLRETSYVRE